MIGVGVLAAAFALASAVALLFGASLGHAFTFGQLAFAATLVALLLRR